MTESGHNEGIVVTGGSFAATNVAVGRNASVVVNGAAEALAERGEADVAAKLQELLDVLRAHEADVPDAPEAYRLTERVAEELSREQPDTTTVESFLTRLSGVVSAAAPVATAALALARAVGLPV